MALDGLFETRSDPVQGGVPIHWPAVDHGLQQAPLQIDGFRQGRALGA